MVRDIETKAPEFSEWKFVDDLKKEQEYIALWTRKKIDKDEISLKRGFVIDHGFPDKEGVLDVVYKDIEKFFCQGGIKVYKTSVSDCLEIATRKIDGLHENKEFFRIDVCDKGIYLNAFNAEGIRRGNFHLENMILSSDGPFLKKGTISREPWIKNRISRCFFGPVKRPPFNRDELADEIEYYPEEYLNRLSHEGINVLWITIEFRDLCKTRFVKEYGLDSDKKLEKLKNTVEKLKRYGIRLFLFTIEPRIWDDDDPLFINNPQLAGAKTGSYKCFCPFSDISAEYIYEVVKSIFSKVPDLGGIINISHGERPTTCLSSVSAISEAKVDCPRCSLHPKGEILRAVLDPFNYPATKVVGL